MKLGFLSRLFEGALSIEKTYNQCDKAIGALRAYNENQQKENAAISAADKAELDNTVNIAIQNATRIIEKEGERNWPGVFREMHKNLANIYLELDEYDKVREKCEHLQDYGEVGKLDAEEVLKNLNERENGDSDSTPAESQHTDSNPDVDVDAS
ncbi:hypothetical protein C6497_02775 [Candidatus Poribacteria bacterium]|nr:MAG: hypothetical protein C6497_02775 [Candidatus Poribacteria bacterium]